jgi:hypothetical protein
VAGAIGRPSEVMRAGGNGNDRLRIAPDRQAVSISPSNVLQDFKSGLAMKFRGTRADHYPVEFSIELNVKMLMSGQIFDKTAQVAATPS